MVEVKKIVRSYRDIHSCEGSSPGDELWTLEGWRRWQDLGGVRWIHNAKYILHETRSFACVPI